MKKLRFVLLTLGILLLGSGILAAAQPLPELDVGFYAGGGDAEVGPLRLEGAIGQPYSGAFVSGSQIICIGCTRVLKSRVDPQEQRSLYLPIMLRQ